GMQDADARRRRRAGWVMNAAAGEGGADAPAPDGRGTRRRIRGWRVLLVVVVLAGAAVAVDRTHPFGIDFGHPLGQSRHASTASADNAAATSTAAISRRSLSAQTSVDGTLGYTGEYTVLGLARGTVAWLPVMGQVIRQGQVLYRVNGKPVVLLYGSTPVYRALAEGAKADDVTGKDVRQLNHDLVALGYASSSDLDPSSDEFGWATKAAIENLQKHLGVSQTGKLDLGQVVFLPAAARVTSLSATLGGQGSGPVLKASSTTREVTVDLDAAQQSEVKSGDTVTITLPNGQTTPGTVTSVGKVATTSSGDSNVSPTVEVTI